MVALIWRPLVASWVGSGREQAILGETGGDAGDWPPLRPLAERVTMGLSLSANHFWYVKLGKPLTRVSVSPGTGWDRYRTYGQPTPLSLTTYRSDLRMHKIGTSPTQSQTLTHCQRFTPLVFFTRQHPCSVQRGG